MKAALLLALLLAGCASTPAVRLQCLPLKPYTPAEQQALAVALAGLPDGSPLAAAMIDYGQLRTADRACLAVAK